MPKWLRNCWYVIAWDDEIPAAKSPELFSRNVLDEPIPVLRNRPGYMHCDTPYLLICDKLLDFPHLGYVHEKTPGGSVAIAQSVPKVERVERGIQVSRRVPDVPPPPYYRRFRNLDSDVDRWFVYDFLLPGTLLMASGGRLGSKALDAEFR